MVLDLLIVLYIFLSLIVSCVLFWIDMCTPSMCNLRHGLWKWSELGICLFAIIFMSRLAFSILYGFMVTFQYEYDVRFALLLALTSFHYINGCNTSYFYML
jgi:hypothetical protein